MWTKIRFDPARQDQASHRNWSLDHTRSQQVNSNRKCICCQGWCIERGFGESCDTLTDFKRQAKGLLYQNCLFRVWKLLRRHPRNDVRKLCITKLNSTAKKLHRSQHGVSQSQENLFEARTRSRLAYSNLKSKTSSRSFIWLTIDSIHPWSLLSNWADWKDQRMVARQREDIVGAVWVHVPASWKGYSDPAYQGIQWVAESAGGESCHHHKGGGNATYRLIAVSGRGAIQTTWASWLILPRVDDVEDSSILRRGIPVAHSIFGTAQTINSANYVYFGALQELLKLCNPRAIQIYSDELCNLHRGQGMDLFWRDTLTCPTEEDYLEMVGNKTGGLFRLAVKLMQAESSSNMFVTSKPHFSSMRAKRKTLTGF